LIERRLAILQNDRALCGLEAHRVAIGHRIAGDRQ
jgi:hypothetical protein